MPKTQLLLLAILATIVGCTARPPIPPPPAVSPSSSPEFAALAYMLERHGSFSAGERETYYSAYVVPESPLGDAIVKAFKSRTPPVSNSIKVDATSGEARNSANGKRVMSWDAVLVELNGERAVVNVTWYSGNEGAAGYRVELERRDGKWAIVTERMVWIS